MKNIKTILQFSLIGTFPNLDYELNYINLNTKIDYNFIDLNKILWKDIYTLQFYRKLKYPEKIIAYIFCLFLKCTGFRRKAKIILENIKNLETYRLKSNNLEKNIVMMKTFFSFWSMFLKIKIDFFYLSFFKQSQTFKDLKNYISRNQNNLLFSWIYNNIALYIKKYKPVLINFKIKNTQDLTSLLIISKKIKRNFPEIKIFIINHWYENFSLNMLLENNEFRDYMFTYIDYCVLSKDFNENTILERIIEAINKSNYNNIAKVKGLVCKLNNSIFYNFIEPDKEIYLPEEDRKYYTDLTRHLLFNDNIISIELSKSKCHWNKCNFCIQRNKYFFNKKNTTFDFNKIITFNKKMNYKYFIFLDESFEFTALKKIISFIKQNNLHIYWSIRCTVSKEINNKPLLKQAYKYGCREILFGQETFNPIISKNMNKKQKNLREEEIFSLYDTIIESNINIYSNIIYFYPDQTFDEILSDLEIASYMMDTYKNKIIFNFNFFTLFYKSYIYNKIENKNIKNYFSNINNLFIDNQIPYRPFSPDIYEKINISNNINLLNKKNFNITSDRLNVISQIKLIIDSGLKFRDICL